MTTFYDVPDADTWLYPQTIPGNSPAGGSSYSCGHVLPASCPSCDGTRAEGSEQWEDIRAVRDAWKAGQLTARQYYYRSMAVSFDGLPDIAATRAMQRAGWPGPDDDQAEAAA